MRYVSRQESELGRRRSNIPSLVAAFSASSTTGGTIYAFGIFANDLKHALQLSQLQLGAVSAAFFIAGFLSWIPGIVVDKMKMRFSMTIGGISGAFFTVTYWMLCRDPRLVTSTLMTTYPIPILSVLAILICMSCGLIVGSIFKLTMLCGGRKGKGPAVGIAKGFVGLGSGVYATIFQAFRKDGESSLDFLPVIGFFFLICAALPAWVLLPPRDQSHPHLMKIETTPLHFRTMYASLLVLCTFIVTSALADIWDEGETNDTSGQEEDESSSMATTRIGTGRQYGKVFLILLLWLGPIASLLYLPREEEESEEDEESQSLLPHVSNVDGTSSDSSGTKYGSSQSCNQCNNEDDDEEEASLSERVTTQREEEQGRMIPMAVFKSWRRVREEETREGVPMQQQVGELKYNPNNVVVDFRADLSLPEMLQTPSAWLMLWTTAILVGSGTCKTNNMGEMVESLGFDDSVTPATLAIFSVAQAAARILTGIMSESALQNFKIPRPFFLVVASVVAFVAHVILAVNSTSLPAFVIGCTISAIAFGMAWPLMVLIVGDVFGVEHHGANYMFYDGGTKAIGTIFLSELLAGSVYEAHVASENGYDLHQGTNNLTDQEADSIDITCYGPECFRRTHIIIGGLGLTCVVASSLLIKTTREAYTKR